MVVLEPSTDEGVFDTEDMVNSLRAEGSAVALVLLAGVHYYTGQQFDMARIARVGHEIVPFHPFLYHC